MPDTQLLIELDGGAVAGRGPRPRRRGPGRGVLRRGRRAHARRPASSRAPTGSGSACSTRCSRRRRRSWSRSSRGDATYRFDGLSTEAPGRSTPQGDFAPHGQGGRPDARARPRGEGRRLARHLRQRDRRGDLLLLRPCDARSRRRPAGPDPDVHVRAPARHRLGVPAGARRRSGATPPTSSPKRGSVVGHFHALDPLADPQGELSLGFGGDALRVQAQRRPRRRRARPGVAHPRALGRAPDGRLRGRRRVPGPRTRSPARRRCCSRRTTSAGEVEPLAAAAGLARRSAFAARLTVEIDTAAVGPAAAGQAHRARAGARVGRSRACYLVERVRHVRRRRAPPSAAHARPQRARPHRRRAVRRRLRRHSRDRALRRQVPGHRRRQRRSARGWRACARRCPRSSARRRRAGACPAAPTPARGPGSPRCRRSAASSTSSGRPATPRRVPIWSGGAWPDGEGVDDAGPDAHRADDAGRPPRDRCATRPAARRSRSRRRRGRRSCSTPTASSVEFGSQKIAVTRTSISLNDGALEVPLMPGYVLDAGATDHLPARRPGHRRAAGHARGARRQAPAARRRHRR